MKNIWKHFFETRSVNRGIEKAGKAAGIDYKNIAALI
jgi:hypothetical protein